MLGVDRILWAKEDYIFMAKVSGSQPRRFWPIRWALSPSLRAALLFRLASTSSGIAHAFYRNRLISQFGCDVGAGVRFEGAICLPHPVGIVIGTGVVVQPEVVLYQNVTLGRDGRNEYPVVGTGSKIYAGAVVAGGVHLAAHSRVSANSLVKPDSPGKVEVL